jgi:hypothetical protein
MNLIHVANANARFGLSEVDIRIIEADELAREASADFFGNICGSCNGPVEDCLCGC